MKMNFPWFKICILIIIIGIIVFFATKTSRENAILRKIIERLTADSRVAQVVVTQVKSDPLTNKLLTTIKFLEYDTRQKPLAPKYFTFSGNIIQFQSMVIRFDDFYVKRAHPLKGKSAYLFMKVFALSDKGSEVFNINRVNEVPAGYRVEGARNSFERSLWQKFWQYALDPRQARQVGIRNAQIEAPGTKFVPGIIYTVKIEHNGGMRIDAERIPSILKGERVDF